MKTLVLNIAQLVAVPPGPVRGTSLSKPPMANNAALLMDDGRIVAFGPQSDFSPADAREVIDAAGGTVVPGLVDCHTHSVFAGSREQEFVQRIRGVSYIDVLE